MRILLGLTGSVATTLHEKLYAALSELGEVRIILTKNAKPFVKQSKLPKAVGKIPVVFEDIDEWRWEPEISADLHTDYRVNYRKDDPIVHIDLAKWADVLVVAPCSANTMAKMAYGLCDNLLTSIVRAWPEGFPLVYAPAMNTQMWNKPQTTKHLQLMSECFNSYCVLPISKTLACGDVGIGAMADISDIMKTVRQAMQWQFPLKRGGQIFGEGQLAVEQDGVCPGIPVEDHPGSFGFQRKHSKHTGVDLYAPEGTPVYAIEPGKVLAIEHFTGPQDNSPWWLNTDCVLIEGRSGVICYGEIQPHAFVLKGNIVKRGDCIGWVKRVVKTLPTNPPYGHRPSMLHVELYDRHISTARSAASGQVASDGFDPELLRDPTPFLLSACCEWELKAITATGVRK